MSDTNSNPQTVDPNTEDLDAFTTLFDGKASPTPEAEDDSETDVDDTDADTQPVDDPSDETDDDASADEEQDTDAEDDDPPAAATPKKTRAQERIEELNAKFREMERRALEAEARLDERTKATDAPPQPQTKAAEGPAPPDPLAVDEHGKDLYPLGDIDPAYLRDLTKFEMEQAKAEIRRELQEEETRKARQAEEQALAQNWQSKLEATKEEIPDIYEKGFALEDAFVGLEPSYGQYLARTLMELDNGPKVIAYLSDNIEEAQKIVASGALKATIALGGLDRELGKPKKSDPKPARVSTAPEPPKVTTKGNKGTSSIRPDTDNQDDFETLFFAKK